MLVVCWLLAIRCLLVVSDSLFVARCSFSVFLLFVVCCSLFVVCCFVVIRCLVLVVR